MPESGGDKVRVGDYIKLIDDGTLAENIAELTQMASAGTVSNNGMHRVCQIMLGKYWERAVRRCKK